MRREVLWATIASGASQSDEIQADRGELVGLQMPAGWDAASITFLGLTRQSAGAGTETFAKVQDDAGNEATVTSPAADTYVAIRAGVAPSLRAPGRFKLRSGTAALPVNQTAERRIGVVIQISNE